MFDRASIVAHIIPRRQKPTYAKYNMTQTFHFKTATHRRPIFFSHFMPGGAAQSFSRQKPTID
jgi:hypothetical protein